MMAAMASPTSFAVLLAASRELDDDFIDEDMSEIDLHGDHDHVVLNRTVTVRGKRNGQAIVMQYQDYYSTSINPRRIPIYEREVLEVFVAQTKVSFEGTCRQRGWLDKLLRVFGAGGAKGSHAIFETLRLDAEAESRETNFHQPGFPTALERLTLCPTVKRVLLQADTGLTAVARWSPRFSASLVLELVDRVRAVAISLD
jgi:hypothetical protein